MQQIASYNFLGVLGGRYCCRHKLADMVDVCSKRCQHADCLSWPSYNVHGGKVGSFCAVHAFTGMADVVHVRCQEQGCLVRASFNDPGLSSNRFCFLHKHKGMANERARLAAAQKSKKHFSSSGGHFAP